MFCWTKSIHTVQSSSPFAQLCDLPQQLFKILTKVSGMVRTSCVPLKLGCDPLGLIFSNQAYMAHAKSNCQNPQA